MSGPLRLSAQLRGGHKRDVNTLDWQAGSTQLLSGAKDGVVLWAPRTEAGGAPGTALAPGWHGAEEVTSVAWHDRDTSPLCYAAAGRRVAALDIRSPQAPVWIQELGLDDINQAIITEK